MERLRPFFEAHPRCALGLSGGVDSAFLLKAGIMLNGDIRPYFVASPFQPAFERRDAKAIAALCGVPLTVIAVNTLSLPAVAMNGPDRCYHCKRAIFSAVAAAAKKDGYPCLIDGTNATDDAEDRPGMRALSQLGVLSPLRISGYSKEEIRLWSEKLGLPTAKKPAYACLATRIPTGTAIDGALLSRVEQAEKRLMELGYSDFRLRVAGPETGLLQVTQEQLKKAGGEMDRLNAALLPWFSQVTLDPLPRKGS